MISPHLLSPYFKTLAREKRVCPECLKGYLRVLPAGDSPNVAMDCCECGYMRVREAPRSMRIERSAAPKDDLQRLVDELNAGIRREARAGKRRARVTGREGNVIRVDFTARRKDERHGRELV